jgi:hypothetical protein
MSNNKSINIKNSKKELAEMEVAEEVKAPQTIAANNKKGVKPKTGSAAASNESAPVDMMSKSPLRGRSRKPVESAATADNIVPINGKKGKAMAASSNKSNPRKAETEHNNNN